MRVSGNQASRHFAVANYDDSGDQIDLLVNTVDPYEGLLPMDFRVGEHTTRLQVTATGPWQIEILPLAGNIDIMSVPGIKEGSGDYVFAITGGTPDIAHITGNQAGRHFAVQTVASSSGDLLVNTVEPYEGSVILDRETFIFIVTAVGPWSIDIRTR